MITAVLSDVHANLPALEAFVAATRSVADAYMCLGDVVNYGPWNDECLEIVTALPGVTLLEGNHERLFNGADPVGAEIPLVREFFAHSQAGFTRGDLIAHLPAECDLGSFRCIHTLRNMRIFPDTKIEIDRDFMVGHTHYQFVIKCAGKRIVNPGSVGQNRQCIDRVSFALYDHDSAEITLREEPYDFERFIRELGARGYPERCIQYYLGKRARALYGNQESSLRIF